MKQILSLTAAVLLSASSAFAQRPSAAETAPVDSSVRVGTLPCGSTYYLKHNAKPAGRADFHIYYKVGAIQEEDSQNGLAHFLEHMAFNGSKHFPDNQMVDWLATVGVRFGENLNAATGQDQTTYMITNVPLTRPGIVDSALLILHDWAGFINLDTADIDKERGVIIEEWRQGMNAQRRVFEKQASTIFGNSLYARRNIIGDPEVLKVFKYDEIKAFYQQWYRPDMQAFVIVGDFDLDSMEQKLRRTMADIQPLAVRSPKATVIVPDHERPLVCVAADPELTVSNLQLIFREKPLRDRYQGLERLYNEDLGSLATHMINQRLGEITRQEDAPFLDAGVQYGDVVRPFDAFMVGGAAREGEALRTLGALYTELYRIKRTGFTSSELDRAKTETLRSTESYFANRNDRKNGEFASDYMEHFDNGAPYLSPEQEMAITRRTLDAITLDEVNAIAGSWVRNGNSAVAISLPQKAGMALPTEAQVLAVIDSVAGVEMTAYEDALGDRPLMDASGLKGSPVAKSTAGKYGSTVMTLKNGVRVILKSTTLKADEVLMTAFQRGGQSTVAEPKDLYNLALVSDLVSLNGVGDFSRTDLEKLLTGKLAGVQPTIGSLTQGFDGSCSPRDLETLMQLTYLYYTAPRFGQSEWNVLMNQYQTLLPNVVKNPNYILQDSLMQSVYGHNPRVFMQLSNRVLEAASLERIQELYHNFFSDANGMTFVFTGNLSVESLRPLAEKYLGSLPSRRGAAPQWGDHLVFPLPGVVTNRYTTPLETPKVTAIEMYSGSLPYSLANDVQMQALRYILEMRYTKSIREEKGGTYGVSVGMTYQKVPLPRFAYQIFFETDTTKIDELLPLVKNEIDALVSGGVTVEEVTKTREFFVKKFRDALIHNGTWQGYLSSWYLNENDRYDGYEALIQALSPESLKTLAENIFGQGNICTVVQMPAVATEGE